MSQNNDKKVNEMLVGIEPMIWSILNSYKNLSHQDREDICQDVMIFIANKVIPAYDASKNTKFSSFAYRCILNFVNRYMNKRKRLAEYNHISAEIFYEKMNERKSHDTERARERIQVFEEMFNEERMELKPKERVVIQMILDDPDITQREISEAMGYSHPSAVSMMLLRLRRRLKNVYNTEG